MGKIIAICISKRKGTAKHEAPEALLREEWGIEGDAHAGAWHRQVSLLSYESFCAFERRFMASMDGESGLPFGAFGENLLIEGLDFGELHPGSRIEIGETLLEVTQIGKECHKGCAIRERVGDCIMPREGVFARVLRGGRILPGEAVRMIAFDSD